MREGEGDMWYVVGDNSFHKTILLAEEGNMARYIGINDSIQYYIYIIS